jgi:hypothetical protein
MRIVPESRIIVADSTRTEIQMMLDLAYGYGKTHPWSQPAIRRFLPLATTLGIKNNFFYDTPGNTPASSQEIGGPPSPAPPSALGSPAHSEVEKPREGREREDERVVLMAPEEEQVPGPSRAASKRPRDQEDGLREPREPKRRCSDCPALIPVRSLARHIREHHGNEAAAPLICDKCLQSFSRQAKLSKHKLESCRRYRLL